MRTTNNSLCLLIATTFAAAGCAGGRPGVMSQVRTITSIGDQPISTTPGAVLAANDPSRERSDAEGRISGRVVDARGRPVPGASVRVAIGGSSAGRQSRATTDSGGRFTIRGLRPRADYSLIAEHEGPGGSLVVGRASARSAETDVRIALGSEPGVRSARRERVAPISRRSEPLDEPDVEDLPFGEDDAGPTMGEPADRTAPRSPWRTSDASFAMPSAEPESSSEPDLVREEPASYFDEIEDRNPLPPAIDRRPIDEPPAADDEHVESPSPFPEVREWPEPPADPGAIRPAMPDAAESALPEDAAESALPELGPAPVEGDFGEPARPPVDEDPAPDHGPLPAAAPPAETEAEPPAETEAAPPAETGAAPPAETEAARPVEPEAVPPIDESLPTGLPTEPEAAASSPTLPPIGEPQAAPEAPSDAPELPPYEPPTGQETAAEVDGAASPAFRDEAVSQDAPVLPAPEELSPDPSSPVPPVALPSDGPDPMSPAAVPEPAEPSPVDDPIGTEPVPPEAVDSPATETSGETQTDPELPGGVEPTPSENTGPDVSPADAEEPGADAVGEQASAVERRPTWGELTPPPVLAATERRPAEARSERVAVATPTVRQGSAIIDRHEAFVRASCKVDRHRSGRIEDFCLSDLQGRAIHLRDLDADLILLDFWGTWCPPCRDAIPHLAELQSRYGTDRLKVVGIAYEEEAPAEAATKVIAMARKLGVNYAMLLGGADGEPCPLREALNVDAFPTLVLIDRDGNIRWRDRGATARNLDRLDRVIAAASVPDVVRR